jgi:lipopolysaccharide transport system permease protein
LLRSCFAAATHSRKQPLHNPATFLIRPAGKQPLFELSEFFRFRHLFAILIWRSLKVRYQQTVIGVAWALLQPIMFALVFTVIFGQLAGIPTNGIPYPIFVMSGLVVWLFVSQSFSQASSSVVLNAHLVTRIYFPRFLLPMTAIATALVDFLISMCLLLLLMFWYGVAPSIGIWFFLPMLLVAIATVLGLSLWLSALYVPFRDVGHLLPFLVTIWMFLSPVVYPSSLLPQKYSFLYALNPIGAVIDTSRWAFAGGHPPAAAAAIVSTLVAMVLLLSGYWYFRRSEATFADVV